MRALYLMQSELLRLKWQLAALRFERAMHRHALALKAYNPDQPRDELGRWADGGEGGGTNRDSSGTSAQKPQKIAASSRPDGHHFVPRGVYDNLPLSSETRKVFDEAKTGRLYSDRHGWSHEHDQYNKAVRESLNNFLEENGITPEQMTPDQARSFADRVKKSSDPRIRQFNMRIYMREIQYWIRRGPGRNE